MTTPSNSPNPKDSITGAELEKQLRERLTAKLKCERNEALYPEKNEVCNEGTNDSRISRVSETNENAVVNEEASKLTQSGSGIPNPMKSDLLSDETVPITKVPEIDDRTEKKNEVVKANEENREKVTEEKHSKKEKKKKEKKHRKHKKKKHKNGQSDEDSSLKKEKTHRKKSKKDDKEKDEEGEKRQKHSKKKKHKRDYHDSEGNSENSNNKTEKENVEKTSKRKLDPDGENVEEVKKPKLEKEKHLNVGNDGKKQGDAEVVKEMKKEPECLRRVICKVRKEENVADKPIEIKENKPADGDSYTLKQTSFSDQSGVKSAFDAGTLESLILQDTPANVAESGSVDKPKRKEDEKVPGANISEADGVNATSKLKPHDLRASNNGAVDRLEKDATQRKPMIDEKQKKTDGVSKDHTEENKTKKRDDSKRENSSHAEQSSRDRRDRDRDSGRRDIKHRSPSRRDDRHRSGSKDRSRREDAREEVRRYEKRSTDRNYRSNDRRGEDRRQSERSSSDRRTQIRESHDRDRSRDEKSRESEKRESKEKSKDEKSRTIKSDDKLSEKKQSVDGKERKNRWDVADVKEGMDVKHTLSGMKKDEAVSVKVDDATCTVDDHGSIMFHEKPKEDGKSAVGNVDIKKSTSLDIQKKNSNTVSNRRQESQVVREKSREKSRDCEKKESKEKFKDERSRTVQKDDKLSEKKPSADGKQRKDRWDVALVKEGTDVRSVPGGLKKEETVKDEMEDAAYSLVDHDKKGIASHGTCMGGHVDVKESPPIEAQKEISNIVSNRRDESRLVSERSSSTLSFQFQKELRRREKGKESSMSIQSHAAVKESFGENLKKGSMEDKKGNVGKVSEKEDGIVNSRTSEEKKKREETRGVKERGRSEERRKDSRREQGKEKHEDGRRESSQRQKENDGKKIEKSRSKGKEKSKNEVETVVKKYDEKDEDRREKGNKKITNAEIPLPVVEVKNESLECTDDVDLKDGNSDPDSSRRAFPDTVTQSILDDLEEYVLESTMVDATPAPPSATGDDPNKSSRPLKSRFNISITASSLQRITGHQSSASARAAQAKAAGGIGTFSRPEPPRMPEPPWEDEPEETEPERSPSPVPPEVVTSPPPAPPPPPPETQPQPAPAQVVEVAPPPAVVRSPERPKPQPERRRKRRSPSLKRRAKGKRRRSGSRSRGRHHARRKRRRRGRRSSSSSSRSSSSSSHRRRRSGERRRGSHSKGGGRRRTNKRRRRERSRSSPRRAASPADKRRAAEVRLGIDRKKLRRIAILNMLRNTRPGLVSISSLSNDDLQRFQAGGVQLDEIQEICKELSAKQEELRAKGAAEHIIQAAMLSDEEEVEQNRAKARLESHDRAGRDRSDKNKNRERLAFNISEVVKVVPFASPTEPVIKREQLLEMFPVSSGIRHQTSDGKPEVNDVQALSSTFENAMESPAVPTEKSNAASNLGEFTGKVELVPLSQKELQAGIQPWLKKNQFVSAAPVTSTIGQELLKRMGWREGEGLGKNRDGLRQPVMVDIKVDRKGLSSLGETMSKKPQPYVPQSQAQVNQAQPPAVVPAGAPAIAPSAAMCAGVAAGRVDKHPVSVLLEHANRRRWSAPNYNVVSESGPSHSRNFLMSVTVNGQIFMPSAPSRSKKEAKLAAANAAVDGLTLE